MTTQLATSPRAAIPAWAFPEIMNIMRTADGGKVRVQVMSPQSVQVDVETSDTIRTDQLSPTSSATWYVEKSVACLLSKHPNALLTVFN